MWVMVKNFAMITGKVYGKIEGTRHKHKVNRSVKTQARVIRHFGLGHDMIREAALNRSCRMGRTEEIHTKENQSVDWR